MEEPIYQEMRNLLEKSLMSNIDYMFEIGVLRKSIKAHKVAYEQCSGQPLNANAINQELWCLLKDDE